MKCSLKKQRNNRLMPICTLSPSLKIHYLDPNPDGAPVVLLLHGLGATGLSWQLQIPALTGAGFRTLAPDARGFGRSIPASL